MQANKLYLESNPKKKKTKVQVLNVLGKPL
jgi:hypothetical protein